MVARLRPTLLVAMALSGCAASDPGGCHAEKGGGACVAEEEEVQLLQKGSRQQDLATSGSTLRSRGDSGPMWQYLQELEDVGEQNPMDEVDTCNMEDPAHMGCPLCQMDGPTFVFPGGKTRCIFTESKPFRFKVIPGDAKKLLLNFQGGGACLTKKTTTPAQNTMCIAHPLDFDVAGIFNRSIPENPYKDWTVLDVFYCSGDMFIGNMTRNYTDNDEPVVQHGYWNAKSAVDWAVEQFPELDSLAVTGSSAGCGGVMFWADYIFKQFEGRVSHKAAICDSLMGFVPEGLLEDVLEEVGQEALCTLPIWPEAIREACYAGQVPLEKLLPEVMAAHPDTAVVAIHGKADPVCLHFYNVLASDRNQGNWTEEQFVMRTNQRLSEWNAHPNFASYLVNDDFHTFLPMPILPTTDTSGIEGTTKNRTLCDTASNVKCAVSETMCSGNQCCPSVQGLLGGKTFPCPAAENTFKGCEVNFKPSDCMEPPTTLFEWLADLPLHPGSKVTSRCGGTLKVREDWELPGAGTRYCAAGQAGKVFARAA
mmetsp:Transcript_104532/g.262040  ORF Transcript_104532/g.262040 Transcript_104532/m.262040 type:complete len:537 (+) Transcript_104532:67-1677(+)